MKLNEEKFKEGLIEHKKDIARLGELLKSGISPKDSAVRNLYSRVNRSGRELALAHSGFKCEKTGKKEDLQFHHMIGRPNKHLTSFYKYSTQRYYWANIVILTQSHHKDNYSEEGVISEVFKKRVIDKYFDTTN